MFLKSIKSESLCDVLIPSLFFDIYLATATGNQIKVYLLGYKSAYLYNGNGEDGVDNSSIAMALGMSKEEVEEAWYYWEKLGVVKILRKKDVFHVKFLDIKYNYIKKHYDVNDNMDDDDDIEDMDYENIFEDVEILIKRPLVPNEKITLNEAKTMYCLSDEMILEAFKSSMNDTGGVKSISYVVGVMKSWFDNSIKNKEELKRYNESRSKRSGEYKKMFSALGFYRIPTDIEKEYMDRWLDEYEMEMDLIMEAFKKSVNISNPSIKYFDSIIKKWYEKGIKNIADFNENKDKLELEKKEALNNSRGKYAKQVSYNTKFHNFKPSESDQYSEENLQKLLEAGIQTDDGE